MKNNNFADVIATHISIAEKKLNAFRKYIIELRKDLSLQSQYILKGVSN